MQSATVLIVEADRDLQRRLFAQTRGHGYTALAAASVDDAIGALESAVIHVALVDLLLGEESGLEVVRRIKARYPEAEVVVVSDSNSVEAAIQSYELNVFAYVPKPFDFDQLFAIVNNAIERRQINLANRRSMWELQLINDIGDDLRRSLDPRDLLGRALQRLLQVLEATSGSVRLLNPLDRPLRGRRGCRPPRGAGVVDGDRREAPERPGPRDACGGVPRRSERDRRYRESRALAAAERFERAALRGCRAAGRAQHRQPAGPSLHRRRRARDRDHCRSDWRGRAERPAPLLHAAGQAAVGSNLRRDWRSDCGIRCARPTAARQRGAGGILEPCRSPSCAT